MKIVSRSLVVICVLMGSVSLRADESDDKLDAILKEITRLNERIRQLEIEVGRLRAESRASKRTERPNLPTQNAPKKRTLDQIRRLKTINDAESTIRLQQESPSELLKNVHQREQELRKRQFPADVVPF